MAKKQDKISRTEPASVTGGNAAPAGTTTAASEQEVPLPLSAVETAPEPAKQTDQKPVVEPLRVPVRNIFGQPVVQQTGGIGHGNAK